MDPRDGGPPASPGALTVAELRQECGYDEHEECSVDALIDYKNALEDRLVAMIDAAAARRGGH